MDTELEDNQSDFAEEKPLMRGFMEVAGKISDERIAELDGVDVPKNMVKYQILVRIFGFFSIVCVIGAPICIIALLAGDDFSFVPLIAMGGFIIFGTACVVLMLMSLRKLKPHLKDTRVKTDSIINSIFEHDFNICGEAKRIHFLTFKDEPQRIEIYVNRDDNYVYFMFFPEILRVSLKDFVAAFIEQKKIIFIDNRADLVKD